MTGDSLRGRRCLITGGGRDLGRAIAASLAAQGAAIVVHYNRSKRGAESLVHSIRRSGRHDAWALHADLRSERQTCRMIARAVRRLGGIDILVNSAGLFVESGCDQPGLKRIDELYAINVRAPLVCARECARVMREHGGGRIINISSLGAFEHWPRYLGYCASKAALVSATRTLALALAPQIQVNSVAPGMIDLPLSLSRPARARLIREIPARRLGTYQDVVDAVLFFCTAGYVTGQVLLVDGGATLV